jgi:hypothetical protein
VIPSELVVDWNVMPVSVSTTDSESDCAVTKKDYVSIWDPKISLGESNDSPKMERLSKPARDDINFMTGKKREQATVLNLLQLSREKSESGSL